MEIDKNRELVESCLKQNKDFIVFGPKNGGKIELLKEFDPHLTYLNTNSIKVWRSALLENCSKDSNKHILLVDGNLYSTPKFKNTLNRLILNHINKTKLPDNCIIVLDAGDSKDECEIPDNVKEKLDTQIDFQSAYNEAVSAWLLHDFEDKIWADDEKENE